MKIGIIGASKGIGLECVQLALEKGHQVRTLSRSKISITNSPNLESILGDATKEEDISQFLNDLDAIIITLGRGKNTSKTTLFSDFSKVLLAVNQRQKIEQPLIVLTGFGAGDSRKYLPFPANYVFKFILNKVYADKDIMESLITNSNLKWEIVRPGMLTNGILTEKYEIYSELEDNMKMNKISRKDVADFMVKQAENQSFLRKYVTLMGR